MIFNFIILNKKVPQLTKTIPAQIEKTVTDTDLNSKTKPASDSSKLAEELAAIHGELSQIRATLREQGQTLGTTDSDIEDLLGDINVSTSSATPTAKLTPAIGSITLRSVSSADIHQEKSTSSVVIGHIYFGEKYPYFQKTGNWYLTKTPSIQGWVNASLVKEVN